MKKLLSIFIFILCSSGAIYAQAPSVCFNGTNQSNLFGPTGSSPLSLAHADFNNDGKLDIATANRVSNDISVLLGTGTGSFATAVNYSCNVGPYSIITSDFNGDGNVDIATADYDSNSLSVLFGFGNGTFSTTVNYPVGSNPMSLASADLNSDGKMDIVVANYGNSGISVLLGSGNGIFNPANTYTVGFGPMVIKTVDLNNDGNKDLVTCNWGNNTLSVLSGLGNGSFGSVVSYNIGIHPKSMTCADFNGDGNTDIVTANTQDYSVLLGTSSGTFGSAITYTVNSSGQYSIISDDFDKDFKQDILIVNSRNLSFFQGSGTGSFTFQVKYNLHAWEAIVADFNGDGNLDIAGIYTEGVTLLFGKANGIFESALNYDIAGNAPYSLVSGDFNKDGHTDIAASSIGTQNISVVFGLGNASMSAPVSYSTDISPRSIISTDLNGDGNLDLVASNMNSSTMSVFLGSATGVFVQAVSYPINSSIPLNLISADFNADSKADIAIASVGDISVLLGLGTGGFLPPLNYAIGHSPIALTSNDFNNDGYVDITFTDANSNEAVVLLGDGAGAFTTGNSYSIGQYPESIISGDFNGDGNQDLATANNTSNDVSVLLGLGTGLFSGAVTYSVGLNIKSITSADLNRDNKPDLIVANNTFGLGNVSILMGSSTGTFGQPISYAVGSAPNAVITADFNEDGNIDIATANLGANNVGILINSSVSLNPPNSICAGNSATLTAINASSYVWSTGAVSNSVIINPTVSTAYTVTGTNLGGCSSVISFSIEVLTSFPTLSITASANSVCVGSSIDFTASGANTYSWSTGESSPNITITPAVSSTYTVIGENVCGNLSQSITVNIDSTCTDVWPGDANSDGTADNLDVLELGLHYTQTGPARTMASNAWQSYFANNWPGTITNGKNLNHSDCNGDGIINDSDTLAIYNNYGLIHTFKTAQTNTINPVLTIIPDQASVVKGTWGSASINIGSATDPINNINGVAFTIDFDNSLIETNNIYIEYQNSFLDAGQNLYFRKLDFANGKIYTAITHTLANNANGFGKIATLHYQIKSSLTTDETCSLGLIQANKSDASGNIVPLSSGVGIFLVSGTSVGFNLISISPNPTNGFLTLSSKTDLQKIEVLSVTGQTMLTEIPTGTSHTLSLESFANGIYFVNVHQNDRIVKREKVVLNK
ncbi:MAG: Alkaline phosphatase [Bacteroidetes bacterium]|jgi:hypothetical protein|nr:Alkaline phosphatase [Bacteroidota bacterium]